MKRFIYLLVATTLLAIALTANAQQVSGRFGFEYNEAEPWGHPKHELLLSKLANICSGGDINVNGLGGGWRGMQPSQNDPINFAVTDSIVQLFGRHGFSLAWNVWPNAPWAFPNKPDCQPDTILGIPIYSKHCAPEPDFEQHWIDYITAVVERYNGDGVEDMPGLVKPVRTYIMTGEIEFGKSGKGDADDGPFWFDSIDNLLRLHRITYEAVHAADPSGNAKVISSGALLMDLYADFPDYPEFDPADPNSSIQRRLNGENFIGSTYTAGWDSLKKMLSSFGNDADGIECDYIGWHPHFSWRTIDQEFAFIRAFAGNKPIYVDDMWSNLFAQGYFVGIFPAIPGEAQFNAPANVFTGTDWVKRINGDFPNMLFTKNDPYGELFQKLNAGDQLALEWYYANGARRLVKSFVSAFGEGAIIANFSGANDVSRDTPILGPIIGRGTELGWINLTGTRPEDYFEKPQYYTYKLLVEKLHDFTAVTEINVSSDPHTRVYKFNRPRGAVYVAWSETGEASPNLDYSIATGETVTFGVDSDRLIRTHILTEIGQTEPEVEEFTAQNRQATLQLGYQPIILEALPSREFTGRDEYEISISNLRNTVTNVGIFGKLDKTTASGVWPCNSGNSYLWIGDLWVGAKLPNGEVKVTVSADSSKDKPEWIPTSAISVFRQPFSRADEVTETTFRSDETGIEVTQRNYAWRDTDFIIYSFEIHNTGTKGDLDSVFVGLRWDFDVSRNVGGQYNADDLVGLDIDNSVAQPVLGYVRDDDGDGEISPGWIGNYFLNQTVFTHYYWANGSDQFFDEDEEQFRWLAWGQFRADDTTATDRRMLQAIGPFTLNAGETLGPVDVALVIGDGLNGLRASRNTALANYLTVDVESQPASTVPTAFSLEQNYPNPFNPSTVINYQLPVNSFVRLSIYTITGRLARTLVHGETSAGQHNVVWDATDDAGVRVASGVYFVKMQAGEFVQMRKLLFTK